MRPRYEVTPASIDEILGVNQTDKFYEEKAKKRGAFWPGCADHKSMHCHPYGATPINKLGHDQLYMIIVNYDKDRDRSKDYIQTDVAENAIDYLVHELAYAMMNVLQTQGSNFQDLAMLTNAISTSKYLRKLDGMEELLKFGCELWLEYHKKEIADSTIKPRLTT